MKPKERAKQVLAYMLETRSSIVETAKYFGVSQGTIHSDIKKYISIMATKEELLELKNIINSHTSKSLDREEIEELNIKYNNGRSISSLANDANLSKATISKYISHKKENQNSYRLEIENKISKMADYFVKSDKTFDEICDDLNMDSTEVKDTLNEIGRIIVPQKFDIINSKYNIYNEDEEIGKIK